MDNEEFRRKLSEVANWTIPKLSPTDIKESQQKKRGRGRPSYEEQYQDAHEEIFLEIHNGINPTHPPELKGLKCQPTTCEDCGAHCPNGRHKETKLYETGRTTKKRNWRERCVTCQKHKNPFTGQFDLTPSEAPHVWTAFLANRKGVYQTEGNKARELLAIKASNPTAIEDDKGIISFYTDSASEK